MTYLIFLVFLSVLGVSSDFWVLTIGRYKKKIARNVQKRPEHNENKVSHLYSFLDHFQAIYEIELNSHTKSYKSHPNLSRLWVNRQPPAQNFMCNNNWYLSAAMLWIHLSCFMISFTSGDWTHWTLNTRFTSRPASPVHAAVSNKTFSTQALIASFSVDTTLAACTKLCTFVYVLTGSGARETFIARSTRAQHCFTHHWADVFTATIVYLTASVLFTWKIQQRQRETLDIFPWYGNILEIL